MTVLSLSTFLNLLVHSYEVIDVDFWLIAPFFCATIAVNLQLPSWCLGMLFWPFSFHRLASTVSEALAHAVSRMCARNVTVSNFAKENLIKHLGVDESRIEVIPNGVDEAFSKAHSQTQWGRMIFVGRLEPQKRLNLLIAAFKIVRQRHEEAELHIIGSGSLQREILRSSRKVGGLFLHGPISRERVGELISELSSSWVFVSASEFETFGMSLAEAFQIGLPAVLTQSPNNAAVGEYAIAGHNCLVVEHNNPKAIAEAVEKLYGNEELWRKFSYNAKYLTPILSWEKVAFRTEAMYERVVRSSN